MAKKRNKYLPVTRPMIVMSASTTISQLEVKKFFKIKGSLGYRFEVIFDYFLISAVDFALFHLFISSRKLYFTAGSCRSRIPA